MPRLDGRSEESLRALDRALETPGIGPRHRARLLVLAARAYRGARPASSAATQVAERALDAAKDSRRPLGDGLGAASC